MCSSASIIQTHRIREGEPGLLIPPRIMALSAMEQKLGRVGLRNFKGAYVASTLRASDLQCRAHAVAYFRACCEENLTRPNYLPMTNQIWRRSPGSPYLILCTNYSAYHNNSSTRSDSTTSHAAGRDMGRT